MTTRVAGLDAARTVLRKLLRDARDKNKWRKIVKFRLWMPVVLQILLVLGLILYTESKFPGFASGPSLTSILVLATPLIIATIAQTHAILVGYLDLSVGAMISFGVVTASFMIGPEASAAQILVGVATILLFGLLLGLVNSGLVRGLKIPSIIATLATLSILDGISLTRRPTAQGIISSQLTDWLKTTVGDIPIAFIAVLVGAILLDVWLHASSSGLAVRAVGHDERAAKRNGVRTNWIRVRALLLSGLLAALASIFVTARSAIGSPQVGSAFALESITAAVLGGAALAGGRATFFGGAIAALLIALIPKSLPYLERPQDDRGIIVGVLVLVGIILFQSGDLKELVKRNYRRARRLVLGSNVAREVAIPDLYSTDVRVIPAGRTLIRGGTVLTMDPALGEIPDGDVLIEGDTIVAVAKRIDGGEAEVIDAAGMIVIPGFVDTHRHIWEGLLRNIGTDVPLEGRNSYISFVLHKLAPAFRPEDAYVGNLVSALGAIDAGVTTLLDWSHIQGSPAHTDAVVKALDDSGIRAVFAYGFPWWGKWEERQPSWFVRAANEHFATKDQLLTLALAAPGPEFTDFEVSRDHWKLARETDARISTHVGVGSYGLDGKVQRFGEAGLLGPDTTYIHCTTLNDTEIQMIVDSGGTVSLASPVEMMMGHGMPPVQKFLDRGLAPSLSVDVETNVPADMFNQMRSILALQRAIAAAQGKDPADAKQVLSWATIEGARANGLDHKTGSIKPGKQADITLLRTDRLNVTPWSDPVSAVVTRMDTGNVDSVLVAGKLLKRRGHLLHVDWSALMREIDAARAHVLAKSGFRLPKI